MIPEAKKEVMKIHIPAPTISCTALLLTNMPPYPSLTAASMRNTTAPAKKT